MNQDSNEELTADARTEHGRKVTSAGTIPPPAGDEPCEQSRSDLHAAEVVRDSTRLESRVGEWGRVPMAKAQQPPPPHIDGLAEDFSFFLSLYADARRASDLREVNATRGGPGERKWWSDQGERYERRVDRCAKRLRGTCISLMTHGRPSDTRCLQRVADRLAAPSMTPAQRLLDRAAAECRRLATNPRIVSEAADGTLSQTQQDLLVVLAGRKAFSQVGRTSRAKLASYADTLTDDTVRKGMADLVDRRLAESKRGRGGGYWLTERGRVIGERLLRSERRRAGFGTNGIIHRPTS
jgi:hypothetical protein